VCLKRIKKKIYSVCFWFIYFFFPNKNYLLFSLLSFFLFLHNHFSITRLRFEDSAFSANEPAVVGGGGLVSRQELVYM
jgi:hypothetical protein